MSDAEGSNVETTQNLLFDALSNHRRRFALYACNQADGEISLSAVAEQVAAWEYDKPIDAVTSEERKRIYTSLQQHHLSRLEKAGLIEVERDIIRLTDKARNIDLYLDVVTSDTIPWSLYYLGLAIIGGVSLFIVTFFEMPELFDSYFVAFGIVLLFLISSIVHYIDTRAKQLQRFDPPDGVGEE